MSARVWIRDPGVRLALGAAVLGVVAVVWALVGAVRTQPLPPTDPRGITSLEAIASAPHRGATDLNAALENDLFSPNRTAPATRYRMPNESQATDAPAPEPEKPVVLGTAVATDGRSFATVKLGEGNPTLVHVGDRIGEWTVRSIERGQIVIVSGDGVRANIAVPKPGT